MGKRDFDKEMESYLSARRKGKQFSFKDLISKISPKKEGAVSIPDDVEVYSEAGETKVVEPKESVGSWFKRFFSVKKKDAEDDDIDYKLQAEDAVSDLKIVTKIALEAIKSLPVDKVKEFRKSESFEQLKKILKKHELIK
ncbi:MAG TPA: hypothetical protein ENF94_00465 [Candidatus Woesearchaeota archaeon]|nr:MAG: hypothetical protein DRJ25_01785 [Candidatus Woesearchaeota archaeon]HDD70612.1 hypothetical protein [Candidatus Woesearchaeota archaeon]